MNRGQKRCSSFDSRVPALLLAAFLSAPHGLAADSEAAAGSTPLRAELQYTEKTFGVYPVALWQNNLQTLRQPFAKEPVLAAKSVQRGCLKALGLNNDLNLIWVPAEDRLIVDLNRNGDLTDDPNGVFVVKGSSGAKSNTRLATFTSIPVTYRHQDVEEKALLDLTLHNYGSQLGGTMSWRSCWLGKATLDGADYEVGLIPDPVLTESFKLVFRRWELRNEPLSVSPGSPSVLTFPRQLFAGKQSYGLTRSREGTTLSLVFAPAETKLGELTLDGKHIDRIVLPTADGNLVAVLDQPGDRVKIPVGKYTTPSVVLRNGKDFAYRDVNTYDNSRSVILTVSESGTAKLKAGGPLANTVTVHRRGSSLTMDYKLLGADGQPYKLDVNRQQAPQVTISRAGKVLNQGNFEFG